LVGIARGAQIFYYFLQKAKNAVIHAKAEMTSLPILFSSENKVKMRWCRRTSNGGPQKEEFFTD